MLCYVAMICYKIIINNIIFENDFSMITFVFVFSTGRVGPVVARSPADREVREILRAQEMNLRGSTLPRCE